MVSSFSSGLDAFKLKTQLVWRERPVEVDAEDAATVAILETAHARDAIAKQPAENSDRQAAQGRPAQGHVEVRAVALDQRQGFLIANSGHKRVAVNIVVA